MRMATSMVLVLIMAVGCSGAEIKDKTDEKGPAEDRPIEKASPEKIDPFQVRLDTFEAAYVDLVCRANRNYDPTGAFVKLHEPLAVIPGDIADRVGRVLLGVRLPLRRLRLHDLLPLPPCRLVLPKIERLRKPHVVLSLVFAAAILALRAAHHELPGSNEDEVRPRGLVADFERPAGLRVRS